MGGAIEALTAMRRKAVFRLFDTKFNSRLRITVGSATCENAAGADRVYERLCALMEQHNPGGVVVDRVGCTGKCDMEPIVTVIERRQIPTKYVLMNEESIERVFNKHILGGEIVSEHSMLHLTGGRGAKKVLSLCGGTVCPLGWTAGVESAFRTAIHKAGIDDQVMLTTSVCRGRCANGPLAFVHPDGVMYERIKPEDVEKIVEEHLKGGKPVSDLVADEAKVANRFFPLFGDVKFFGQQLRVTLRNCGVINPESIDEYLAVRGYEALATALDGMSREDVVQAMKVSGLRGRGGGGYPTGTKWELTLQQKDEVKYIICNADEGDPGAFMDRSTIEGDPHTILEGMLIGGYAVGASQGFVYIRAEYPLAIKRLDKAIAAARAAGFLGKNILGSGFDFDIEIRLGAGAFVCGEETALIRSIEGQRGMPRPRPPYPSVSGLWGKPTVINNVETFANVPVIILDGPEWFASVGTERSKGTKVFALAGDVENTGLIEVPMGTSLREVVYGLGGGVKDGKGFRAVQTGGPAGGCLPASELDTPIDYDSLSQAGSIMGSGGMIVMDDQACMVNVARYFIEFTQDESCGKCTPCREGTKRMLEILTRITKGGGAAGDVEKLQRLADTVKRTSLCGLGQAAPNPVLSTIKHFRSEYDAHVLDKRCPAGVCKNLLFYLVIADACVGCGACKRNCPVACIAGAVKKPHEIDQARCIKCGRCFDVCKFAAIERK